MKRPFMLNKRRGGSSMDSSQSALKGGGFRVKHVSGDGNCLFRSVAHQIYGDDRHHKLVRQRCMDYMELEADYYCNYIDGGRKGLQRYIQRKRCDGCWGDHLEIAAICELYDRPAEIWSGRGGKTYQTPRGHPQYTAKTATSATIPVIRLSYYGGCHYDSIIGNNHTKNLLTVSPGSTEEEKLKITKKKVLKEKLEKKLLEEKNKKEPNEKDGKDRKVTKEGNSSNEGSKKQKEEEENKNGKDLKSEKTKKINEEIDDKKANTQKKELLNGKESTNEVKQKPSSNKELNNIKEVNGKENHKLINSTASTVPSSLSSSLKSSSALMDWLNEIRQMTDETFINEVAKKIFSVLNKDHKKPSKEVSTVVVSTITRDRVVEELRTCLAKIREKEWQEYLYVKDNLPILFHFAVNCFLSDEFIQLYETSHKHEAMTSASSLNPRDDFILKSIPIAFIIRELLLNRRKRMTDAVHTFEASNSTSKRWMSDLLKPLMNRKNGSQEPSLEEKKHDENFSRACFLLEWLLPHLQYQQQQSEKNKNKKEIGKKRKRNSDEEEVEDEEKAIEERKERGSNNQRKELFILIVKIFGRFEFGTVGKVESKHKEGKEPVKAPQPPMTVRRLLETLFERTMNDDER